MSNAKKFKLGCPPPLHYWWFPRFTQKIIPVIPRRIHWKLCGNGQCASRALFLAAVGLSTLKTKLRRSRRSYNICRREHQNCVSRDLSRRSTPGSLEIAAGTLRTQNLGDIPATAAQSPLQPRPQLIVWKLQSVNNGGDKSFFACSSIESIILSTKLISGLQSENLQFCDILLNYENVICYLTRISVRNTHG